jgi:hypothetical protein
LAQRFWKTTLCFWQPAFDEIIDEQSNRIFKSLSDISNNRRTTSSFFLPAAGVTEDKLDSDAYVSILAGAALDAQALRPQNGTQCRRKCPRNDRSGSFTGRLFVCCGPTGHVTMRLFCCFGSLAIGPMHPADPEQPTAGRGVVSAMCRPEVEIRLRYSSVLPGRGIQPIQGRIRSASFGN